VFSNLEEARKIGELQAALFDQCDRRRCDAGDVSGFSWPASDAPTLYAAGSRA
jgi:hypothetical protein